MTTFPRLHFLSASLAPIVPKKDKNIDYKNDIESLTDQCLNYDHFFQRFGAKKDYFDAEKDKFMALSLFYRGNDIDKDLMDINQTMQQMRINKKFSFVEWNASDKPSIR